MRLSIEVTPEQHQRLKAVAALSGMSIKDYVLARVLPDTATPAAEAALVRLEALLEPRVQAAKAGQSVNTSVRDIFEAVHRETP